jgi:hypothetical protein
MAIMFVLCCDFVILSYLRVISRLNRIKAQIKYTFCLLVFGLFSESLLSSL